MHDLDERKFIEKAIETLRNCQGEEIIQPAVSKAPSFFQKVVVGDLHYVNELITILQDAAINKDRISLLITDLINHITNDDRTSNSNCRINLKDKLAEVISLLALHLAERDMCDNGKSIEPIVSLLNFYWLQKGLDPEFIKERLGYMCDPENDDSIAKMHIYCRFLYYLTYLFPQDRVTVKFDSLARLKYAFSDFILKCHFQCLSKFISFDAMGIELDCLRRQLVSAYTYCLTGTIVISVPSVVIEESSCIAIRQFESVMYYSKDDRIVESSLISGTRSSTLGEKCILSIPGITNCHLIIAKNDLGFAVLHLSSSVMGFDIVNDSKAFNVFSENNRPDCSYDIIYIRNSYAFPPFKIVDERKKPIETKSFKEIIIPSSKGAIDCYFDPRTEDFVYYHQSQQATYSIHLFEKSKDKSFVYERSNGRP